MLRLFALFANLLIALILKLGFTDDIGITSEVPTQVVAGSSFEVKVTIKKGELASFSRLLQTMPAGLTATSVETANADFSFDDKKARFIWMNMPSEKEIMVSYTIKVDPRLKGQFSIASKFSYIADNERRTVTSQSGEITILPSPTTDPSLIVDINDYELLVIPYIPVSGSEPQIACIRQAPVPSPDGKGYIVNILVSKERKEKFAKIEETIPEGYKAEAVNERDAIFTFKKNTAKYLWMNLPASSFFLVSYKLVPTGMGTKKAPTLQGTFSYLEEAKTITINIQQTPQDLAQVKSSEDLNLLIQNIGAASLAYGQTDGVSKHIPVTNQKEPKSNKKTMLEPEEGIYYRVQLAAGHSPVNVKRYFKSYKLEKEVRHEYHEGWYKYSVGSFPEYKVARDYREQIWNSTTLDDAFVSAYNNGTRITVQEALMISNQRWYK
ncbi:MAG: SPOR domain-containing protein [Bacteroidota bacterium]|nr:MAG: SPOR domain-containing protein [Bacteroidota bacterium]